MRAKPMAMALTHTVNGVAGLYGVVTTPEARGLGVARALCLKALHASAAAGARRFVLHSTPVAVSLYRSTGLIEVAPFPILVRGADLHR